MLRRKHFSKISTALVLALLTVLLCGCGKIGQIVKPAEPTAEPGPVATPAPTEPVSTPAPTATPTQPPVTERQNGERFEGTMTFQGMPETIRYEHIRNDALGFEMDYDYERFVRQSEPDRERFISVYDDPEQPENYLEVTSHPENAETVAAFIALHSYRGVCHQGHQPDGGSPAVGVCVPGARRLPRRHFALLRYGFRILQHADQPLYEYLLGYRRAG